MMYIQRGQPEYVRATLALFGGAFVTFAELYATQPIMPELSRRFHVTPTMSSLSFSVVTAALAISMLWVSGVSDSIASGWVGQFAPVYRAQASSLYLLFYYAGSSVAGAIGGLFWVHFGWQGVIGMIAALLIVAALVERMVSRALIHRKPVAAHADADAS